MLTKLLPMLAFLGTGYATNSDMKEKMDKVLTYVKTVAVQYEVNQISKMVYMDTFDGLNPSEREFTEYVRKNMSQKAKSKRDTTKDFWGEPYRLRYISQPRQFLVISSGEDRKIDSEDDIVGGFFY